MRDDAVLIAISVPLISAGLIALAAFLLHVIAP